jgi:NAD(P)-dependent dehydrogenase (short-subunit alcohol dehydrogenase family)
MNAQAPVSESVAVVGVGPGLGFHIARRFAADGLKVAMLARDETKLRALAGERSDLVPYGCDATDPRAVAAAFDRAERELGPLACVVFNAGVLRPARFIEIDPQDFEQSWKVGAFAGFVALQQAAKRMIPRGRGTILVTGATASIRGGAGFANFAPHKFALRALTQCAAREWGPFGIHVAHIIIDGRVDKAGAEASPGSGKTPVLIEPACVADLYAQLHAQHRSAWTQELDLRPASERF